jgi:recombinational DNA repair ATPase RecF
MAVRAMSDVTIKRISVENFRGIIEVDIPFSRQNLLLYGENGSGKSSFVDAFEYLVNCRIERFDRQDVNYELSIPYVNQNRDTVIKLTCDHSGNEVTASIRHPTAELEGDRLLLQWLGQFAAFPPILRRAHIVKFIEIKGAERLQQLSRIIGLDTIDSAKTNWESEKRQRLKDKKSADEQAEKLKRRLDELTRDLAGSDLIDKINSKLVDVGLSQISTWTEIERRKQDLNNQITDTDTNRAFQQASQFQTLLIEVQTAISSFMKSYGDFYPVWQEFIAKKSNLQNNLLSQFLVQGQKLLSSEEYASTCPLCEQEIDSEQLHVKVSTRIQELDAFSKLSRQVTEKRTAMHGQANNTLNSVKHANDTKFGIELDLAFVQAWVETLSEISKLQDMDILSAMYPELDNIKSTFVTDDLKTRAQIPLDEHVVMLQTKIGNTEIASTLMWLGNVEEAFRNWEDAKQLQASADKTFKQVSIMQEAITKAREQRLNEINSDIAKTVNDYYQRLHPNEGYGDIQLVSERKGAGIGITAEYHGRQSHPLGFYSEGHLDSLGIAIFLAYIRRFAGVQLLILDDIMATIDGAHRLRLARLLADEFTDYQIILTTHDRLWTEELQGVLDQLQTVQLYWTIDEGVQTKELLEQKWDTYIDLAKTEPADAVLKCARDFEKFLNQMRFNLSLAIPAKYGDQYSIGEMQTQFFAWIKKKKIQHPNTDYESKLDNLEKSITSHMKLRNFAGAHYNEWAANLSQREATDFVQYVKDLVELFTCPCCRKNWVGYSTQTKTIYCSRCAGKNNAPNWLTS